MAGSYLAIHSGLGVLFAVGAGVLVSLMLAFGAVSRRGDPIVLGIALNLMAIRVDRFPPSADLRGARGVPARAHRRIGSAPHPRIGRHPWIGPVLFNQTILGYLAFLLVPILWLVLFRTPIGCGSAGSGSVPWRPSP